MSVSGSQLPLDHPSKQLHSSMKLYNPIVGSHPIKLEKGSFDVDTTMEFPDDIAEKLILQYPFLVKISDPKYSPDSCEPLTKRRKSSHEPQGLIHEVSESTHELSSKLVNISRSIGEVAGEIKSLNDTNKQLLKLMVEDQERRKQNLWKRIKNYFA